MRQPIDIARLSSYCATDTISAALALSRMAHGAGAGLDNRAASPAHAGRPSQEVGAPTGGVSRTTLRFRAEPGAPYLPLSELCDPVTAIAPRPDKIAKFGKSAPGSGVRA